jgi:mannosyltransferase
MSSLAVRRRALADARVLPTGLLASAGLLCGLLALSLFLRTRGLDAWFWIDEGLSVGIASHPLGDIPEVLRKDGSPPLYYLLLNVWIDVFGRSEEETHLLSLGFALLCVPAGLWAGWSVFGRRAGWFCAGLFAISPFLTHYAQETRMYSMMTLLGLLATACFLHGFVLGRRRYLPAFAVLLALMLYTHNWAVFFAAACVLALIPVWLASADRGALTRDALLSFGGAALLFAPWLPTLLYQIEHTGAPWSFEPNISDATKGLRRVLNGEGPAIAALLGAGAGFAAVLREDSRSWRRTRAGARVTTAAGALGSVRVPVIAAATIALGTLVLAWVGSQISPAWALRYFTIFLGPLLLVLGVLLSRAGWLGVAVMAVFVFSWPNLEERASDYKSNLRGIVVEFQDDLRPGDVVLSTHPERLPNIHYYLGDGPRYATSLESNPDPRVMDWRDARERLERATVPATLEPLLDSLPRGARLLLVQPVTNTGRSWAAPWTSLVKHRAREWGKALAHDERFKRIGSHPPPERARKLRIGVRAVLYAKA